MNELERTARMWLEMGIATLPVGWKSKRPEVKSWAEYTERLPEPREIERWYISPYHNIAVLTGWQNLCILDFDTMSRYFDWLRWAETSSVIAAAVWETSRIVMSSRGVHLYFYTREKGRNYKLDGIDVLCDRKYALMPPSIHPSGVSYTVLRDNTPARIQRVEDMLPEAWLPAEEPVIEETEEERLMRLTAAPDGWSGPDEESAVRKVKQLWRMEDFFPDAIPSGRGWCRVRCPLHDDRNPSAGVNFDQQIFVCFNHCYGTKPLDVIGLYARMHGVDNGTAIREMACGNKK